MLRRAALVGMFVLWCAYTITQPPSDAFGVRAIFTSAFGHVVMLPIMLIGGIIHLWQTIGLALSTHNAIEFTDEGIRVATGSGVQLLPWAEFKQAKVQKFRINWIFRFRHLILKRVQGGAIRLRLDMTNAHGANEELIYELIRLSQAAAFARGQAVGPAFHQWAGEDEMSSAPTAPAADGGFDPDAALARYLERKKAGMLEPPSSVVRPPMRAGFGRKGL